MGTGAGNMGAVPAPLHNFYRPHATEPSRRQTLYGSATATEELCSVGVTLGGKARQAVTPQGLSHQSAAYPLPAVLRQDHKMTDDAFFHAGEMETYAGNDVRADPVAKQIVLRQEAVHLHDLFKPGERRRAQREGQQGLSVFGVQFWAQVDDAPRRDRCSPGSWC